MHCLVPRLANVSTFHESTILRLLLAITILLHLVPILRATTPGLGLGVEYMPKLLEIMKRRKVRKNRHILSNYPLFFFELTLRTPSFSRAC